MNGGDIHDPTTQAGRMLRFLTQYGVLAERGADGRFLDKGRSFSTLELIQKLGICNPERSSPRSGSN